LIQCATQKKSKKHQAQKTYNKQQMLYNWKQGEHTHKDSLANIIMLKNIPLWNYHGIPEAYMTSVSNTLSNEKPAA
jgi:uncharacterized protein (DUF924 family)